MATAPLFDVARSLGGITWYLRQTFWLFGGWARDDEAPQLARVLASHSNRHGELANTCHQRLPTITLKSGHVLSPEQFVGAPSADDEAQVSKLELGTRPESRLAAANTLNTRILELVDAQRREIDERLDAPTASLLDEIAGQLRAHLVATQPAVSE